MRRWSKIAALAIAGAGLAGRAAALETYTFHDLGPASAAPIGDTGQIALPSYTLDAQGKTIDADTRLWGPQIGTDTHLGNLASPSIPGAYAAAALGNNVGQLTGVYSPEGNHLYHGFLWTPGGPGELGGTLQQVGFPGEQSSGVAGVSDAGQVAGTSGHPYGFSMCLPAPPCPDRPFTCYYVLERAFRFTQEHGVEDLGTFSGPNGAGLHSAVGGWLFHGGTDAQGSIVGRADLPVSGAPGTAAQSSIFHPFLWTEQGGMRDLSLDMSPEIQAMGVSAVDPCMDPASGLDACTACGHGVHFTGSADFVEGGEVTGNFSIIDLDDYLKSIHYRGFYWSEETGLIDIGTLGGNTRTFIRDMHGGLAVGEAKPAGCMARFVTLPAASAAVTQPLGTTVITPPSGAGITLPPGEKITLPLQTTVTVPAGASVALSFLIATLEDGRMVMLSGGATLKLLAPTTTTPFGGISVLPSNGTILFPLPAGSMISLGTGANVELVTAMSGYLLSGPAAGTSTPLPAGEVLTIYAGGFATLTTETSTTVSYGTHLPAGTFLPLVPRVDLPNGTTITVPDGHPWGLPAGTYTLPFQNGFPTSPGCVVRAPDGTVIPLPDGASIELAPSHAFVWRNDGAPMIDLHQDAWKAEGFFYSAAEYVRPAATLSDSQIVGEVGGFDGLTRAVLWTKGQAYDLHPCGWKTSRAFWIDSFGNIGIQGQDKTGAYRFAIYTPDAAGSTLEPFPPPPPTIECPADIRVVCGGDPVVTFPDAVVTGCEVTVEYAPPSGSTFPVGTTTVIATATDGAGRTATCSFQVVREDALTFDGFLPPIGGRGGSYADPVRTFKLGSTIPVKFRALCGGTARTDGPAPRVSLVKWTGETDSTPAIDATPTDAATDGSFARLTGDQWHYNLATRPLSKGVWEIIVTLDGGATERVFVQLK